MTWGVNSYSTTPGANSNINGINIAEGMNSSGVNDAIRQMMADIANMLAGGILPPSGTVQAFLGNVAPTGWQFCDGSAISRTTYSALYAVIGVQYGAGDGSTTFNVPDYRGRTLIGAGTGPGLTGRTLAAEGGEETHQLTIGEVPTHAFSGTTNTAGAHTHTLNDTGHSHTVAYGDNNSGSGEPGHGSGTATENTGTSNTGITVNGVADHQHTFSGVTDGGNGGHNNMQPFVVCNFIVKL